MRLVEIAANPNFGPGMAYWISPRGEVLDVTPGIHITAVINHPEKFGFTDEKITELYDKHGETVGSEGKAREEIMRHLFKRGWIRTRLYRREDTWSVNVGRMTNKTFDLLVKWAKYHRNRDDVKSGKFGDVKLSIGWDENMTTKTSGSLEDYANGNIQEGMILEDDGEELVESLVIVESAADLIVESSLSRLMSKTQNHSVGTITAWREDYTRTKKNDRNKDILAYLLNKGYDVTKVGGKWIGNSGKEEGERSFFVANTRVEGDDNGALEKDLIMLGRAFEQDAIVSARPGREAVLIGTNHDGYPGWNKQEQIGTAVWGNPSNDLYSTVNGRKFSFESLEPVKYPGSGNGVRAMRIAAKRVEEELNKPSIAL